MSVEVLETIKQQMKTLSPQEKAQLADYLRHSDSRASDRESGATEEIKNVKRRLRDEWIKRYSRKYGGLYVALDGDHLLGTGKNYPEALEAAKRAGVTDAFVDYVRPTDYIGETGGW